MNRGKNYIYIVYKTTNLKNNKIYVGVHKQLGFIFDGYIGSGVRLQRAVEKYGEENFVREILFFYYSESVAYKRERFIVNLEFLSRSDVYNIKLGGKGGWDLCKEPEVRVKVHSTNLERYGSKSGKLNTLEVQIKSRGTRTKLYGNPCGQMHTPEVRSKITYTRNNSGYNYIGPCHTLESRLKAKESNLLNGVLSCKHMNSSEVRDKARATRKSNGTDRMTWCHTLESKARSAESRRRKYGSANGHMRTDLVKQKILNSRRSNSLAKYPYLLDLCEVIDFTSRNLIFKGNLLELSVELYGETRAIQKHRNLYNRLDKCTPFKSGTWKGNIIISVHN